MSEAVRLELRDGVADLVLARPDAMNAIDPELAAALKARAQELTARDDVRCVLLRAEGRAFGAGGDLAAMAAAEDPGTMVHALASDFHDAIIALEALDAPVVTVVQGVAAGGGFSLAIVGDLVLAAESARFTMAYTAAALSPDGGSSWTLPRIVGLRKALALTLLNERLTAAQALELGLVSEVVADDALEARARELAATLAAGPTGAYGRAKRLLRAGATATFEEQLAREADDIATSAASDDGREGIAAFLAKRAPRFTGR
ncbi:enoyl-CoA hydratase/isomerase family protein [Conexibacter sp. SYSU D00693]|uniref:enoyl-CoA hydratase/isomerase family protein n=1 Tax=Conexibacter sp. SYSU D00693 TaxID=2812560 RepID=UPI00196B59AE|nr:enoyl-CoA hydratase-related protein [Conexibacter sp. SYSU D00693]